MDRPFTDGMPVAAANTSKGNGIGTWADYWAPASDPTARTTAGDFVNLEDWTCSTT